MITEDEWSLILDLTEILSHFADTTNYLGGSKYCTYSSMNSTIIEIMKHVYPSSRNNSNLINMDVDKTADAFGEISKLEKDREINIPVNTHNLLDQIKENLYNALIYYFLIHFKSPCSLPTQLFVNCSCIFYNSCQFNEKVAGVSNSSGNFHVSRGITPC